MSNLSWQACTGSCFSCYACEQCQLKASHAAVSYEILNASSKRRLWHSHINTSPPPLSQRVPLPPLQDCQAECEKHWNGFLLSLRSSESVAPARDVKRFISDKRRRLFSSPVEQVIRSDKLCRVVPVFEMFRIFCCRVSQVFSYIVY